jgi:hypothetical protein
MSFLNSIAGKDQIRNIREWKWIIVLSFLCLLCGYHDYLDIVLVCFMEVIILTCNINQLFYSFILLYFFEEVICLDNLYGLSLLVLTPIIGLRLLLYMFRHKILPSGKDFGLLAFIMGSGVVPLLTGHLAKATLVVMMNMVIVVLFGSVMRRAKDRKKIIEGIVFEPVPGEIYDGKVTRIIPIGAFVEIAPGKEGLVHISKLENRRVETVEDVCAVGDAMRVKFLGADEKGRLNLSRKDALGK